MKRKHLFIVFVILSCLDFILVTGLWCVWARDRHVVNAEISRFMDEMDETHDEGHANSSFYYCLKGVLDFNVVNTSCVSDRAVALDGKLWLGLRTQTGYPVPWVAYAGLVLLPVVSVFVRRGWHFWPRFTDRLP